MNPRPWICAAVLFVGLVAISNWNTTRAQQSNEPVVHPRSSMKFAPVPNLPACATGAVEDGDPAKGESTLVTNFTPGCSVPWHWHTPTEIILVVSGTSRLDMKGSAKAAMLHAGDFATMPSHHVHQARCVSSVPCVLFIHSTAAFDIHYVNAAGDEIPMSEATKPAAHKPAANK